MGLPPSIPSTFSNAIEQGLRRAPSVELLRGVFDAAMSVYLDRFLNIPAAKIPEPNGKVENPAELLDELENLLNKQQQVNQAANLVTKYLHSDGNPDELLAKLGQLLLREDRDFHTIQTIETAFNQYQRLRGTQAGTHVLVAAARYLAAHSPTVPCPRPNLPNRLSFTPWRPSFRGINQKIPVQI